MSNINTLIHFLSVDHDVLESLFEEHGHPIRLKLKDNSREYLFNDYYTVTLGE